MKIGITMFTTDLSIGPVDLAREAEARGFHSLYVPEHTHIPTSRRTPPPTGEPVLAEEYRRTLDPFVALAAAAAATSRIRLGTSVCLVAQHDPVVLAKTIATLDLVSRGRVVLGIGFGWNREEMESHGVDFRRRRALVREKILAMQRLWTQEAAAFEGELVRFAESWSWPKPLQRPHPPILLGGAAGPKLFAHVVEYGDGWMPIGGAGVAAALPDLRRAVAAAGRDPARLRTVLVGTLPERAKLDYYESLGVTEVALRVPSGPREQVLPVLDAYAHFARASGSKEAMDP
jgi:probable F420-dependent oxidoreductase